ncbi:MAG: CADD family putative folate metabolism protein [SAR202 cluster bacterium]|nr:CADD family putative folate metabolism protein [SAR202 cluster bacterium]
MAKSLLNRLEHCIAERSLLKHTFYQDWQAGRLTLEDLAAYAAQYYFFEAAFPRFLSAIHSRCPDRDVRQAILDNLWDEEHGTENHRALWLDFCAAVGLNRKTVERQKVHPNTQALLKAYEDLCGHRSFQEGLAAVYAYESQVPEIALQKMRGLKGHHGIYEAGALKFFAVHSTLDEDHSRREREAIAAHTSAAQEPAVEEALHVALDVWWGFLDGVQELRPAAAAAG